MTTKQHTVPSDRVRPNLPDALGVPVPASPVIEGNNAVFHARELNTAEVAEELSRHPKTRIVQLYADTVTVSASTAATIEGLHGWQIMARETRFAPGAALSMGEGAQLVLYTGRIVNPDRAGRLRLRVAAPGGGWHDRYQACAAGAGLSIRASGGELNITHLDTAPLPRNEEPVQLARSLTLLFQTATQLWAADREQAVSMLRWVSHLATRSTSLREVFAQASSLVSLHDSDRLHGRYVPRLDRAVYGDSAKSYKDTVKAYEDNLVTLRNRAAAAEERAKAARVLLANLKDTNSYHTQLVQQAQANSDAAARTLAESRQNLDRQRDRVERAKSTFQGQMEEFKDKKIEEAVVNGAFALLSLGLTVASGAIGGIAAAGTANQLVHVVDTAKSVVETAGKIDKIVKDLWEALELLDQVRKLEAKMSENASDLSRLPAEEIDVLLRKVADSGSVNSSAKWEEFQTVVRAMFGHMVQNIGIGAEYQAAMEMLSVDGRAFVAAQAGYVQASQQLIRATLQADLTRRSAERMESHIADLVSGKELSDTAAQTFYQGYLDQKRWLFVALENYGRAFRYWALREPDVTPTMAGDAVHITGQLAGIAHEYEQALDRFRPPPQTMDKSFSVTEGIRDLAEEEAVELSITLDHPEFAGLERVRLKTIRVHLVGAEPAEGKGVRIGIHSSGLYQDRFGGTEFRFSTVPAERAFEYKADQKGPVIDGTVEAEFGRVLMQPTPFTQWRFTVRKENNPGLDLSGLSEMRIEMFGSAISAGA